MNSIGVKLHTLWWVVVFLFLQRYALGSSFMNQLAHGWVLRMTITDIICFLTTRRERTYGKKQTWANDSTPQYYWSINRPFPLDFYSDSFAADNR